MLGLLCSDTSSPHARISATEGSQLCPSLTIALGHRASPCPGSTFQPFAGIQRPVLSPQFGATQWVIPTPWCPIGLTEVSLKTSLSPLLPIQSCLPHHCKDLPPLPPRILPDKPCAWNSLAQSLFLEKPNLKQ